jgi:phosphatidylinositol-3-phosphatase
VRRKTPEADSNHPREDGTQEVYPSNEGRIKSFRHPFRSAPFLGLAIVAALAACGARQSRSSAASLAAARAARPCGANAAPRPRIGHVIWIWMENHSTAELLGAPDAPYLSALARGCGVAVDYRAVAHPSLPNYLAATSGTTGGIGDDGPPSQHPLASPSLFEQAGSSASYEESMPANCDLDDAYPYAVKHDPEAYYTRIRKACLAGDVPLGTLSHGPFIRALRTGQLPAFSLVTPNLCNDMHDCSVATGDAWLARWVGAIVASTAYRSGHTVVFITWDESDGAGNEVPLIVVSPFTRPGTRSSGPFTHYSLLRTTEELLGLRPYLGLAASAKSMRSAFGL